MKMDKVASSHCDEYYIPVYAITPLLKYLKQYTTIWCPFDTEESNYVKIFRLAGFNVITTHINNGQDFFEMDCPKCDYIISNPPYTKKTEVLERLFELDIPFAMLLGVVGLFESQKRFEIFKNNKFEIMYFNKRISFFQDYITQKIKINPPFSSVYICHNILDKQIVFEYINKPRNNIIQGEY